MALSVDVRMDFSGILADVLAFIQAVRIRYMQLVLQAYYRALQQIIRILPYPSVRGQPPNGKTGRLLQSFRAVANIHNNGSIARIYAVNYAHPLRVQLERHYTRAAWGIVKGQLSILFSQAVREAGGNQ